MKRTLLYLFVAVAFASGTRGYAHHSFAAYLPDKMQTIEGDIEQFLFNNPHSFLFILAPDENGQKQRWAVEWGARSELKRLGVSEDALKPGDHVIITGNPWRNPADRRLRMRTIVRPSDGWKWAGISLG